MFVPQLEMHPFCLSEAVPGLPVLDLDTVQNSAVVPHCSQMSQHAFNGHSLSVLKSVPCGAVGVLLTFSPQMALAMGAGIGG